MSTQNLSGESVSSLTWALAYFHDGYFTRAMDAWLGAWAEGRQHKDPLVKALVDRAVGELARMHARVGRSAELRELLDDIGDRPSKWTSN